MRTILLAMICACSMPALAHAWSCTTVPDDPCELPAQFTHTAVVEEAGVRVTLASAQADYLQGDPIEFRMVFENVGTTSFCINLGYQPIDAVFVLPDPCTDPGDCPDLWPWYAPNTVFFAPGVGIGLDPGQCRVFSYVWDMASWPAAPGDYDVMAGVFESAFSDPFAGSFLVPSTGVSLPLHISAQVPTRTGTMSTMKGLYR